MKIPDCKIELASGKDAYRPALCNPFLTIGKNREKYRALRHENIPALQAWEQCNVAELVATNGHILALHPVQIDPGDVTGEVTIEALQAARKAKQDHLLCNGSMDVPGGAKFPRMDHITFPDYQKVIPDHNETLQIGINPELLFNLAKALGWKKGTGVMIEFKGKKSGIDPNGAMRVTAANNPEAIGVLMPMRA